MTTSATRNSPVQVRAYSRLESLREVARQLYNDPAVGRDRLTTGMIAEGAGCSIGTIYRYYKDRVAVLDDIAPDRDMTPIKV